jgi:hypothetical protein
MPQSIAARHAPQLYDIGVVTKCHNPRILYIIRQKSRPEDSILVGLSIVAITGEAVDKDDAVWNFLSEGRLCTMDSADKYTQDYC